MSKTECKVRDKTYLLDDDLDIEEMQRVQLDAMNGVSTDKSSLTYTPELLEYRKYFEDWRTTLKPGEHVDFPSLL